MLSESARRSFQPEVYDLAPLERREIRIKIFGIDPSATTAAFGTNNNGRNRGTGQMGHFTSSNESMIKEKNFQNSAEIASLGEEHQVYVRRHISLSLNSEEYRGTKNFSDVLERSLRKSSTSSPNNEDSKKKGCKYISLRLNSETNENASLLTDNLDTENVVENIKIDLMDKPNSLGHDLIPYTGVSLLFI